MGYRYNALTGEFDVVDIGTTAFPFASQFVTDSGTAVPVTNVLNVLGGTGIETSVVPDGSNNLYIGLSGSLFQWNRVAGPAVAMSVDNGYIPTNAAVVTLTLPAAPVVGDIIEICGEGLGGWIIGQNAGQSIQFGNVSTTVGVGGTLQSSNRYDTVRLVCRLDTTTWHVLSNTGVLNVI